MKHSWITDRKPRLTDLRPIYEKGDYVIYGEHFLAWDGNNMFTVLFVKPPKRGGGYYTGYWKSFDEIKAWMPLPTPPEG